MHERFRSPAGATLKILLGKATILGAVLISLPGSAFADEKGDVDEGKALYEQKCTACHSIDESRIGPLHRGIVGRKVASIPTFNYSDALRKLGGTWTRARIDTWLQNPQAMVPGTIMFFMVDQADERREIIAYLATQTVTAAPKK